ncbi:MAG: VOC family protein, partial [Acidobacteriaceae bacterium]
DYKLAGIRLLVSDFKACFRFYQDRMGFNATYGNEDDVYADFDTGSVTLALFSQAQMSEALGTSRLPARVDAQDRASLVFAVGSVDETCQHLLSQGIELLTEPQDRPAWGIRTAHLRDPDGNLIELYQPLAQA